MGKQQKQSLRRKAAHFVSDLLNPISDKPSESIPSPPTAEDVTLSKTSQQESTPEESSYDLVDGPDTSSFTAFMYSLLSSSDSGSKINFDGPSEHPADNEPASSVMRKESSGRKSLLSRGKQTLGRALHQAARLGVYRNQTSAKGSSDMAIFPGKDTRDEGIPMQTLNEPMPLESLPETSEPSLLLSEKTRSDLYVALPALVQGNKWVLLYSTWRHGISLSTLYRRSVLCPGISLLVVGDRKGAVFGGLVDAPMRPTNKRKYQGTNSSFVFTNRPGRAVIFHPTGMNSYFTLCSTDYLALGGGSHFALYLDADLLNGSSSASETYGNSCLAHTEDFEVKEVELWGFVYASKYEDMISILRTEAPGICRW